MKQVGGTCPCQGIRPTGKGTPGQEVRVFLAFYVLMPLGKGRKCIYALRELGKSFRFFLMYMLDERKGLAAHTSMRAKQTR